MSYVVAVNHRNQAVILHPTGEAVWTGARRTHATFFDPEKIAMITIDDARDEARVIAKRFGAPVIYILKGFKP
jgi:hypothetical protein